MTAASPRIGAVILAAGFSSRMGAFKPLLELGGRTLLAWCSGNFRDAGVERIVVVTGHRAGEVQAEAARLGLKCVHNATHAQGMFSSVRAAFALIEVLDAILVLPVDIPLVRPTTIRALLRAFDGRVTYPTFQGERGHPPLIPASLAPRIAIHDGQGGLKHVLDQHPSLDVPIWDRGVLLDADTEDDFATLRRKAGRLSLGEAEEARVLAELTMPERGLAHGRAVARVAVRLGEVLNGHRHALDLEVLHNAALLHDIAKGQKQHEQRGGEMLVALGLDGLADIVASHRVTPPPASGRLTEKEIVCLADKLVRGPRRTDVRTRFQEKLDLYRDDPEACAAIRGRMNSALALQHMVEKISGQDMETILAGALP